MPIEHQDPIILVLGADDAYVRPLAVALYSALENMSTHYPTEVHIVSNEISSNHKHNIESVIRRGRNSGFAWHEASDLVKDLPVIKDNLNTSAYITLHIPLFLPNKYSRCIYIDGDVIVKDDLSKLWNLQFGTVALRAVRDQWIPTVNAESGLQNYADLGLAPDHPYFNSGVLLIDLEKWRQKSVTDKARSYLINNHQHMAAADQDVLNALLSHDWSPLDPRWNVHHAHRHPRVGRNITRVARWTIQKLFAVQTQNVT